MTDTIPNVPRELLCELRDAANESMNATTRQHQIDHFAGLIAKADALLSAPSPAGVDGLEVVGTLRYFMDYPDSPHSAPGYITHQFNPASWDHAGEAAGEHKLCRLSDAKAIIDGLRGEVERLQRAEKNDAIAYKAALERQDELRAELAALKAQGVVMPDVNAAAKALCNRHAMICGVDADDQWKEYSQDFIADAETVLANARLNAAPVQHPDDDAVDRFAVAMKVKLAASRKKGRHGWQNATGPHLSSLLHEHMFKGDPLDVGNLAMMLHQNGQAIELPHDARRVTAPVQQVSVPDVLREAIKWADHLCFECGALVQTRAPSVHVYNKTFEAVQAAKAMLAAAPAADAGHVFYGMDGNHP